MLPKSLLVVSKRNGNIYPKYLKDNNLAEHVINLFKNSIGKQYKELKENLKILENDNMNENFKIVRGLATILTRKCQFGNKSMLNSMELRRFLFEKGFVINDDERNKILQEASTHFNTIPNAIEDSFFSDLPDEQILLNINIITPIELIKLYNLSLTQTLMFNSLDLQFLVEDNYQNIFRQIKYLGIIYEIENNEIKITGPASLFKNSTKYGAALAKLIPFIVNTNNWNLKAKIKIKLRNEPRIFNFEIDSSANILFPINKQSEINFHSEVEAQFYKAFKRYNTGWEIKREPAIIKSGSYVIIPDFGFFKFGMIIYLEIVGFWTDEYLQKKIWKLNHAETDIIVAVDKKLNCKKEDFPGDVIFYDKKLSLKPIVRFLKELEKKYVEKKLTEIQAIDINEDIISINDKAKLLNVHPEILTKLKIPNYFFVDGKIVSQNFLNKLKVEIANERNFTNVLKVLNKYEVSLTILDLMDYKILWKGLTPIKIIPKK